MGFNWRTRTATITFGVLLVFVPTLFTVAPSLLEGLNDLARWLILVLWALIAAVVVRAESDHQSKVAKVADALEGQDVQVRKIAVSNLFHALSYPGARGLPENLEFTIYLTNAVGSLVPVYPGWSEPHPDPRLFEPGKGATGLALQLNELVVAKGEAVFNEEYDLTPDQREFFQKYRTAVSAPVTRPMSNEIIGVLTGLCEQELDMFDVEAGPGQASLYSLADTVGAVAHYLIGAEMSPTQTKL